MRWVLVSCISFRNFSLPVLWYQWLHGPRSILRLPLKRRLRERLIYAHIPSPSRRQLTFENASPSHLANTMLCRSRLSSFIFASITSCLTPSFFAFSVCSDLDCSTSVSAAVVLLIPSSHSYSTSFYFTVHCRHFPA